MDNLTEALGILIFILIYGIAAVANKLREKTQKDEPGPLPDVSDWRTAQPHQQDREQAQRQLEREAEQSRWRPESAPPKQAKQPPPLTPQAEKSEEESPWMKMLRELMDADKEETKIEDMVVEEPTPPPPPKPRPKPKQEQVPDSFRPVMTETAIKKQAYGRPYVFNTLAKQAQTQPLRSAILYAEILNKPLALRRRQPYRGYPYS